MYLNSLKRLTALFAALSVIVSVSGCASPRPFESLSVTGTYFDTVITIEAWGTEREVLNQCKKICETYEQLLSPSIDTSDISRINRAEGKPVEVDEKTASLILQGIRYGELSGGKFDITVASASELWDFHDKESAVVPGEEALSEAVSHIDYTMIKVDHNTVTLADPQAKIDLGGIAKGYIADRLKEYLISEGVAHALINLGGNMVALGGRYDGSDFRIGIQKPFAPAGTAMLSLSVYDQSVVTSGNYERYFEKDGTLYHHILDPRTGYPVQNDLLQVTILSEYSVDGDALSTACYALGLEKGMELIQSLDGIEAIFVTSDYEIHTSSSDIKYDPL